MDFFDIFQLASLVVFLLIFIGRTIQLYFRGRNIFVIGQRKSISTNITEIFFSIGLTIWIYLVIVNSLHLNPVILPASIIINSIHKIYLRVPGTILISLGLIIFISGIISFRNSWRIGIDTQSTDILITTGIFAYTRNPIFLFINLYFIGTSLLYPTPFFIIYALFTLFGIHQHIKAEEKFLKAHYGKPYLDYLKKVRRYF